MDVHRSTAAPPATNPVQHALSTAIAHLNAKRLDQAIAALETARAIAPGHPQVHYLLAEVRLAQGNLDGALAHVTNALGWERLRPEPFALAGRLLHLVGDSPLGARFLERAIALAPDYMPAQAWLRALRAAPRMDQSHPDLEILVRPARVSLCMIVKNEARNLGRCLQAARCHVDEIVVVDTGSTDATAAIAATYGARVHHFPWNDDFSAARNAALDHATGDWALVLDADELLETPTGNLQKLLDTLPLPAFTGRVPLLALTLYNHVNVVTSSWAAIPVQRLFPREALRYKGAAHETPELPENSPWELTPMHAANVEAHHHGYRPEVMRRLDKLERNITLMHKRLAEHPDDVGVYFLLGRELVYAQRFQEGYEALEHYMTHLPEENQPYFFRLAPYLQAIALGQLDRQDDALALLDRAIARDPDYPSYHYLKGEKLVALGRYEEAIAAYERALANHDYLERHGLTNYNILNPEHAGALARMRLERARKLQSGEDLASPAYTGANQAIADALQALSEGALAEANARLTEAGELAPTHPQVPYLRAELALREGDIPGALAQAMASLALDATTAEPWALAGYLLHEDGDSALGLIFLERAIALDPALDAARQLARQLRACPRAIYRHPEVSAWLNRPA